MQENFAFVLRQSVASEVHLDKILVSEFAEKEAIANNHDVSATSPEVFVSIWPHTCARLRHKDDTKDRAMRIG